MRPLRRFVLAAALLTLAGAGPAPQPVLLAIPGPLPARAVALLTRLTAFHGDFGTIAVAEAEPAAVGELARRGVNAVSLGTWPQGMDLLVMHADPGTPPEHALPTGGRVLFATGEQSLVAVPAGSTSGIAGHAGALVARKAWKAGAGFAAGIATLPPGSMAAAALPAGAQHPGSQPLLATDPRITPLVAQVNQANLLATVTQLSSYFTRRADSTLVLTAKDRAGGSSRVLL